MRTEEEILERVRRLFALAKSSNEHESAAAAAKAQELLHRYNLSQADVPVDEKQPYVSEKMRLKDKAPWRGTLMHVLTKANGAMVINLGNGEFDVIGQRHVIEVSVYSYQQMEKRIDWLADLAWDIYDGYETDGRMYKDSFRLGLIKSLKERLDKQQVRQRDESASSTALVVQSQAELDAAVKSRYANLSYGRAQTAGSLDGYGAGSKAGSHLNVNPGLYQGVGQRRIG